MCPLSYLVSLGSLHVSTSVLVPPMAAVSNGAGSSLWPAPSLVLPQPGGINIGPNYSPAPAVFMGNRTAHGN